jgi:hypothetical protein
MHKRRYEYEERFCTNLYKPKLVIPIPSDFALSSDTSFIGSAYTRSQGIRTNSVIHTEMISDKYIVRVNETVQGRYDHLLCRTKEKLNNVHHQFK